VPVVKLLGSNGIYPNRPTNLGTAVATIKQT
jgi:hypothetical protein